MPHLTDEGPTRYARSDVSKYEVKRLRRGVYVPDVFLDMHGMTQQEAKRELGAMIAYCLKENVHCACVQHGIGKHILKQNVPLWLAQHPDVLAFHQAPLEFGGDGALLVLLSIPENSASLVTHIRWDRHILLIEFRSLTTFAAILFKLEHKCQHLSDGHE